MHLFLSTITLTDRHTQKHWDQSFCQCLARLLLQRLGILTILAASQAVSSYVTSQPEI
jgi:hypothetical protein